MIGPVNREIIMYESIKMGNISKLPTSLLKFYIKYGIKNYGWMLAGYMFVAFLSLGGAVIWPYIERTMVGLFEQSVPNGESFVLHALPTIFIIILLNMVLTISSCLHQTFAAHTGPGIKNQVSEILTTYAHKQTMGFWVGRMSGSINSQIGYIENTFDAFTQIWDTLGRMIMVFINGYMLFYVNRYVALLFIFALICWVLYAYGMRGKVKTSSEAASGANSSLNGKIVDSLSNYSIVKLFAGANKEKEALREPRSKMVKTQMYSLYISRLFWVIPGLLWDILLGATVLFCCVLFERGEMQVSDIVYTLSVYYTVMGMLAVIINGFPDIINKLASGNKAYKELVIPIEITDKENAKKLVVKQGQIEFQNLYFKYKKRYVLKNLSLSIKPGERVGIVGASGAGKTTLVNLLMRFYEPQRGEILIDGQDIKDIKQDSLRDNIAFIPQDPTMFNRTIGENIGYGKFNATKTQIKHAAQQASADKFIMETEKGYDSLVGDRGIKLSGGQRQRIAIARAFLKNAPILVLDEATSALDSETEMAIQKSFDKLSKNRTTIAIAHRLSTLRNMDRIIVMNKGVIVEQGTHKNLLRKRGLYYKLWQMQSGGFLQEDK